MSNPQVATSVLTDLPPRMEYRPLTATEPLPDTTLCAISFGAMRAADPVAVPAARLDIHVNLPALADTGVTELWHADGKVISGHDGCIRFASGGHYLAGLVEIDEQAAGGLAAAGREAYAAISRFTAQCGHRHLLRMYNYFPAINHGAGDAERYKQFCSGRAAGFQGLRERPWPAATAIGRQEQGTLLQVYWLASDIPGHAIENPRQVSAFRYPRQYGPSPPTFSRAMQFSDGLLISGTASVLGHTSHHLDDLSGQLDEILRNLASLRQASGTIALARPGRGALLKVYLRDPAAAGFVVRHLLAQLPAQVQLLVLGADICRRELLVEIDAACLD